MLLVVLVMHRYSSLALYIDGLCSSLRFGCFEILDGVSRYFSNLKGNFSQDVGNKIFNLQCENMKLKLKAARVDSVVSENERLKTLLKIKQSSKDEIVFARVVNIYNNDFVRSALIDAGRNQNVQLDDFAYNEQGLIGRVIEVSDNWSKVLFIIDANSNIPAKISGFNAILSGNNSGTLKVNLLNGEVKEGDIAESSSYGRVFQEKIIIGRVIKKKGEIFVRPSVNFSNLKYICIGKCQD